MAKILVTDPCFGESSDAYDVLKRAGHEPVKSPYPIREVELMPLIRDVHAVICGPDEISTKAMDAAPDLKIIARYGVGLDNIDTDEAARRRIIVTNARGANADAVADFAFCAILALARDLKKVSRVVTAGEWKITRGVEIYGKTLGVVGTGSIGRKVIQRAAGFDMKVLAYDVVRDPALENGGSVRYTSLEELLRESDIVTLHVPRLPETMGLIGKEQLALMKPTAYLINTARGGIVNEEALHEAVNSGRISGAAVDVYSQEPPERPELFDLENILATPHVASSTNEAMRRVDRNCLDNVLAVLSGKEPVTPVNYPFE